MKLNKLLLIGGGLIALSYLSKGNTIPGKREIDEYLRGQGDAPGEIPPQVPGEEPPDYTGDVTEIFYDEKGNVTGWYSYYDQNRRLVQETFGAVAMRPGFDFAAELATINEGLKRGLEQIEIYHNILLRQGEPNADKIYYASLQQWEEERRRLYYDIGIRI